MPSQTNTPPVMKIYCILNTHSHFPNSDYQPSTQPIFAIKSSSRPQTVHLLVNPLVERWEYLADRFGISVERPLVCLGSLRGCIPLVRSSWDSLQITILSTGRIIKEREPEVLTLKTWKASNWMLRERSRRRFIINMRLSRDSIHCRMTGRFSRASRISESNFCQWQHMERIPLLTAVS